MSETDEPVQKITTSVPYADAASMLKPGQMFRVLRRTVAAMIDDPGAYEVTIEIEPHVCLAAALGDSE